MIILITLTRRDDKNCRKYLNNSNAESEETIHSTDGCIVMNEVTITYVKVIFFGKFNVSRDK